MNTENLYCNRCSCQLEVVDVIDSDSEDYGKTTYLHCPNCGADFECTECAESEKSHYDFYKDDEPIEGRLTEPDIMNGHCLNCGHSVSMSGNFMLSDYDPDIKDIDDDKMNFVLGTCPYCGMNEIRWDTAENDKYQYPYWSDDNKLRESLKDYELYYVIHQWAKVNEKFKDNVYMYENQEVADELRKIAKSYDETNKTVQG